MDKYIFRHVKFVLQINVAGTLTPKAFYVSQVINVLLHLKSHTYVA
ncbi:MAG: hypothetical protein AAB478_00270 [Patescibacteria group bacterium]